MSNASCFSKEQLRSYLLGQLTEEDSVVVASHVEDCESCEATVAELDTDSDTLIQSLREPVQDDPPSSAYRLAAKRAASCWRELPDQTAVPLLGPSDQPVRLRDYELLRPLAQGGMGTVYEARHLRLNRLVALKVLPPRWLEKPALVSRFEREMQAVGSLQHEAIVQATDGGEAEGVHYLVMELIDGVDGGAITRSLGRLAITDACEIARQAALGMEYVHSQGIIHRDLKPSNLMVTKSGAVKVLDLGLARVISEQLADDELTTVGQLMGTIDYMAPEQLENSHQVDERTDIYSLGATLYKLLTGRSPHGRQADEPLLSRIRRIATEQPIPLAERCPDADPALCQLVDQMLSADADGRPASMNEVAESLAPFSDAGNLANIAGQTAEVQAQQSKQDQSKYYSILDGMPSMSLSPTAPLESTAPSPQRRRFWLGTTTASLLLAIVFGVIVTIESTIGQLVIETNAPGVEVRVLKAGKPHRKLTLAQNANRLRLWAGDYEIEIVSDADGLTIENGQYTLNQGETWLAKIVHQPKPAADDDADMLPVLRAEDIPPAIDQPTYEGKTLSQWLALLRKERSPKQFYEACMALNKLATDSDNSESAHAVLIAVRYHNRYTYHRDSQDREVSLWNIAQGFLRSCDQGVVVEAVTKELEQAERANVDFILDYLSDLAAAVRPAVNPDLISQLERIATDPDSDSRRSALEALRSVGPEDVAVRRLVAALSAPSLNLRLYAADALIEMKSNTPLVVSTLRDALRSEELYHRAQAAWLLGNLADLAAPALPELIACVEDDDPTAAAAAAYRIPDGNMTSVKDAAIRALAEIGDDSVVPLLITEWNYRLRGDVRTRSSAPAWSRDGRMSKANTYNRDWVADAIESLSGMRPSMIPARRGSPMTIMWTIDELSFYSAYRAVFENPRGEIRADAVDIARQLLPRAGETERTRALGYIEDINRSAGPKELSQEIEMIELIASDELPQVVLPPVFSRWSRYADLDRDQWKPSERTAAIKAYQECSLRIIRQPKDWQTSMPPFLISQIRNDWAVAGIVFLELIDELDLQQQAEGIVAIVEYVATEGTGQLRADLQKLRDWCNEEANLTAALQIIDQQNTGQFETLMCGLIRAGIRSEPVIEKLTARFVDDTVNRLQVIGRLIDACDDDPDVAQIVVDLIKNPALDAAASMMVKDGKFEQVSLRGDSYVPIFNRIPEQHRNKFRAYLKSLAESGVNGEAEAAQQVLRSW